MVIMKDFPESTDWYIAEIAKVLNDRFVVNGYITEGASLAIQYGDECWLLLFAPLFLTPI